MLDVSDTPQMYGSGSLEADFSQFKRQDRGLVMGAKRIPKKLGPSSYSHEKDGLGPRLLDEVKALQTDNVNMWHLHALDVRKLRIMLLLIRIVMSHVSRIFRLELLSHVPRIISIL